MVGGGDPFYLKFWVNRPPLKHRRFWTNNSVAPQLYNLAKKVQLTLIGSPPRAF